MGATSSQISSCQRVLHGHTDGALKKEPFSFGRGSVLLSCFTVRLRFSRGVPWGIEVDKGVPFLT
eukprot:4697642-Pyramimonas_sp.AAC.1